MIYFQICLCCKSASAIKYSPTESSNYLIYVGIQNRAISTAKTQTRLIRLLTSCLQMLLRQIPSLCEGASTAHITFSLNSATNTATSGNNCGYKQRKSEILNTCCWSSMLRNNPNRVLHLNWHYFTNLPIVSKK
jgi:hypothetical protein